MVVRLLLWNLADSKTTLAELRHHLPELDARDHWISNEATERFGVISFSEIEGPALERIRELIGTDPEVAEEFDAG